MQNQAAQKVWTKELVQELISTNEKALARAVLQLYNRQTAAEIASQSTREHNGRGFNSKDAPFLSDIARKLPLYGNRMTPRQIARVRPMMLKYWRQLLEIIAENGGVVDLKGRAKPALQVECDIEEVEEVELPPVPVPAAAQPQAASAWGMF